MTVLTRPQKAARNALIEISRARGTGYPEAITEATRIVLSRAVPASRDRAIRDAAAAAVAQATADRRTCKAARRSLDERLKRETSIVREALSAAGAQPSATPADPAADRQPEELTDEQLASLTLAAGGASPFWRRESTQRRGEFTEATGGEFTGATGPEVLAAMTVDELGTEMSARLSACAPGLGAPLWKDALRA